MNNPNIRPNIIRLFILLLFNVIQIHEVTGQDDNYKDYISSRQYREAKLKTFTSTSLLMFSDSNSIKEFVRELSKTKKAQIVNDLLITNEPPAQLISTGAYLKNFRENFQQIIRNTPEKSFYRSIWPKSDLIWVNVGEPKQNNTGDNDFTYLVEVNFIKRIITYLPQYDMNTQMFSKDKNYLQDTSYLHLRTIFEFPKPQFIDSSDLEDPKVYKTVSLAQPYTEKFLCLTFNKNDLDQSDWIVNNVKVENSMRFIKATGSTHIDFSYSDFNNKIKFSQTIDSLLRRYHRYDFPAPYVTTPFVKSGFSFGFLAGFSPSNRINLNSKQEGIEQSGIGYSFQIFMSKKLNSSSFKNWFYRINLGYEIMRSNFTLNKLEQGYFAPDPAGGSYTRNVTNEGIDETFQIAMTNLSYGLVKTKRLKEKTWGYISIDGGFSIITTNSYSIKSISSYSGLFSAQYGTQYFNYLVTDKFLDEKGNDFGQFGQFKFDPSDKKSVTIDRLMCFIQPGLGIQHLYSKYCFLLELKYQINITNPKINSQEILSPDKNEIYSLSNLGSNPSFSGFIIKTGIFFRL